MSTDFQNPRASARGAVNEPTDAEIEQLYLEETGFDLNDSPAALLDFARIVLAKWGQPAQAAEPVALYPECKHWGMKSTNAPQPVAQAPVAWLRNTTDPQPHAVTSLSYRSAADAEAGIEYVPVYSAPQPVAREPLTDWDMRGQLAASLNCWHRLTPNEAAELVAFVQRVSAHGIKGGQHGADN